VLTTKILLDRRVCLKRVRLLFLYAPRCSRRCKLHLLCSLGARILLLTCAAARLCGARLGGRGERMQAAAAEPVDIEIGVHTHPEPAWGPQPPATPVIRGSQRSGGETPQVGESVASNTATDSHRQPPPPSGSFRQVPRAVLGASSNGDAGCCALRRGPCVCMACMANDLVLCTSLSMPQVHRAPVCIPWGVGVVHRRVRGREVGRAVTHACMGRPCKGRA
jgi:hypothetical protein